MKCKVTMKQIRNNYKCFRVGYCDLYDVMLWHEAEYYNAGVYGWNCDIYTFGNIAVTTGYRGMTGQPVPAEILDKYTKQAQDIKHYTPYPETVKALEENRKAFFAELAAL